MPLIHPSFNRHRAPGEQERIDRREVIDLALGNQRLGNVDSEIVKISERKIQLQNSLNDITTKITNLNDQKKELDANINIKEKEYTQIDQKITKFLEKNNLNSIQQIDIPEIFNEQPRQLTWILPDIAHEFHQAQLFVRVVKDCVV